MTQYGLTSRASQGNAFTRHLDSTRPSLFCKSETKAQADERRTAQSKASESAHEQNPKMRRRGPDICINKRKAVKNA